MWKSAHTILLLVSSILHRDKIFSLLLLLPAFSFKHCWSALAQNAACYVQMQIFPKLSKNHSPWDTDPIFVGMFFSLSTCQCAFVYTKTSYSNQLRSFLHSLCSSTWVLYFPFPWYNDDTSLESQISILLPGEKRKWWVYLSLVLVLVKHVYGPANLAPSQTATYTVLTTASMVTVFSWHLIKPTCQDRWSMALIRLLLDFSSDIHYNLNI